MRRTAAAVTAVVFGLWLSAPLAAEDAQGEAEAPKCLEAEVNPVTGHAFCTNPRGAPVEPPPEDAIGRCEPNAHADDGWAFKPKCNPGPEG